MSPTFSPALRLLHRGLLAAAKQLTWHPSIDAGIHHGASDRGDPDPDETWFPHVQKCVRVELAPNWIIHLQFQLEAKPSGAQRVIVLGCRVKSLAHATPNSGRATFNSNNRESSGYYLRPRINASQVTALTRSFKKSGLPRMGSKRISLGDGSPGILFHRFLTALIAIEAVKEPATSVGVASLLKRLDKTALSEPEFDYEDLAYTVFITEGKLSKIPVARRERCRRLLAEAHDYFSRSDPDGRLRCTVCQWTPPLPTHRQIVQIHHHGRQLSEYSKEGLSLTLNEALANLVPLCPNCHSVHESKPGGGRYDLGELKSSISVSRT